MAILDLLLGRLKKPPASSKRKENCPSCGTALRLDMKACPKCGIPLSKLFQLVCPDCKERVALGTRYCPKCNLDFEAPPPPPQRVYRCPRCGYDARYYMLSCPACGIRFI